MNVELMSSDMQPCSFWLHFGRGILNLVVVSHRLSDASGAGVVDIADWARLRGR